MSGSVDDRAAMDYAALLIVQNRAFEQASAGKGKERHATAHEAFEDQTMCEIARRLSGHPVGSLLYQAVKKCYESGRLGPERGIAELLGAMNYISGAVIVWSDLEGLPVAGSSPDQKLTMP